MKPTPLNEKQAHFLETRLIPFTESLGAHHYNCVDRFRTILKLKSYDYYDKVLIELLMNKLRKSLS